MKYEPANSLETPRFSGVKTFMRLPHVVTEDDIDFAIAGVPFDTGASFAVGTRFGPEAIRSASSLLRPYNPGLDVDIFKYISGVDYGDLPVVPGYIEDSYARIQSALKPLFAKGIIPILLGGDHSVTLPHLRAAAKQYGTVSLVHFDSHSDTWDEYFGRKYNHGTVFRRAAEEGLINPDHSIQVGLRGSLYAEGDYKEAEKLGFEVITTPQMVEWGRQEVVRRIKARAGDRPVFFSFDIDFLDPAFAPGTGTPEIGGPSTYEVLQYIRSLAGLKFVGFDIVEVLPDRDPARITALAAANVAYEFISLIAYNKKNNIHVKNIRKPLVEK